MIEDVRIRDATVEDGALLADLMIMAGDGIPLEVWTTLARPDERPIDVGRARARRPEGSFSYTNGWVAVVEGAVMGMAFGYRLADEPASPEQIARLPANVRPFVELEAVAPGSFYLNGLATFPGARRQGLGRTLLGAAFERAAAAGCPRVSLTMFEQNAPASALYRGFGFVEKARRPALVDPLHHHRGEVLLLEAPVGLQ